MTGFELRISGIGSNCSTNWATTTARPNYFTLLILSQERHGRGVAENGLLLSFRSFVYLAALLQPWLVKRSYKSLSLPGLPERERERESLFESAKLFCQSIRSFPFCVQYSNNNFPWSPGLVVMGKDSHSEVRRGFESRHRILDGIFFTYICCKNL